MDEFAIRRRMDLGSKAKSVLETDLVMSLFDELEEELVEAWKDSDIKENEQRERLYLSVAVISEVTMRLDALAKDGDIAAEDMEREFSE